MARLLNPAACSACAASSRSADGLVEMDEPRGRVGVEVERFAGEHRQDPAYGDFSGAVVVEADLLGGDGHGHRRPASAGGSQGTPLGIWLVRHEECLWVEP